MLTSRVQIPIKETIFVLNTFRRHLEMEMEILSFCLETINTGICFVKQNDSDFFYILPKSLSMEVVIKAKKTKCIKPKVIGVIDKF